MVRSTAQAGQAGHGLILFLNFFTPSPPNLSSSSQALLCLCTCVTAILPSPLIHPYSRPVSVNWNPTLPTQRWDPKTGLLQQSQGCSALTSPMSCRLSSLLYRATGQESPALASFPQQHLACQQPQGDCHRSCPLAFPSQAFWSNSKKLHANFAMFK